MTPEEREDAVSRMLDALAAAIRKHGDLNSTHEGYAVIKEELEELWDDVKANRTENARHEALQIAASSIRFFVDCKPKPRSASEDGEQWVCPCDEVVNYGLRKHCRSCGRPKLAATPAADLMQALQTIQSSQCTKEKLGERKCTEAYPPAQGDRWRKNWCPSCLAGAALGPVVTTDPEKSA